MRTPSRIVTLTSRSIRICVGCSLPGCCCVMCLPRVARYCIVRLDVRKETRGRKRHDGKAAAAPPVRPGDGARAGDGAGLSHPPGVAVGAGGTGDIFTRVLGE